MVSPMETTERAFLPSGQLTSVPPLNHDQPSAVWRCASLPRLDPGGEAFLDTLL
jgi:hypothetical protein